MVFLKAAFCWSQGMGTHFYCCNKLQNLPEIYGTGTGVELFATTAATTTCSCRTTGKDELIPLTPLTPQRSSPSMRSNVVVESPNLTMKD
ncbi:hypothetical protein WAI453_008345 [Rhynchosporium graminicola]